MNENNKRGRKRTYDAQKTRETILIAASSIFADRGFHGTSIDAVAEKAGYNKSLIFQYFTNKQGLYLGVLKKIDSEINEYLTQLFKPMVDESIEVFEKQWFMDFIQSLVGSSFDFMMEHPDYARLMNWEQAEGWSSLSKVSQEIQPTYLEHIQKIFKKAQEGNFVRSNIDIDIVFLLIQQICWSSPSLLLLSKSVPINDVFSSSNKLNNFRNQVVDFIISGITGV